MKRDQSLAIMGNNARTWTAVPTKAVTVTERDNASGIESM